MARFNGTRVRNLKHLVWLYDNCKDKQVRLGHTDGTLFSMRLDAARKSTQEVLKKHDIPAPLSADLKAARDSWRKGGAKAPVLPAIKGADASLKAAEEFKRKRKAEGTYGTLAPQNDDDDSDEEYIWRA